MSNRRRPTEFRGGGLGHYFEVPANRAPQKEPEVTPGKHAWISIAMFNVVGDPGKKQIIMDDENLLSLHVGCYVCEQPYSPELYAEPCPGEPA